MHGSVLIFCWLASVANVDAANSWSAFGETTTPGCAAYGCDAQSSFNVRLPLPRTAPTSQLLVPQHNLTCARPSPGCVSDGSTALCALPLICNATYWNGYVSVAHDGRYRFNYTENGSGRCENYSVPLLHASPQQNLPAMSVHNSDAIMWDTVGVTFLDGGSGRAEWGHYLSPSAWCPDSLTHVTWTNHSLLGFAIVSIAEVFVYIGDGTPEASLVMRGNATLTKQAFSTPPYQNTTSLLPTANADEEVDDCNLVAAKVPAVPAVPQPSSQFGAYPWNAIYVPITEPAVDGARLLFLTREYQGDWSDATDPRPPITPGGRLFVVAVDQRMAAVGRLVQKWQLPLSIRGTPLYSCIPKPNGRLPATRDPVIVAGPAVTVNSTLVFGLACAQPGSGPVMRSEMYLFGVAVDSPHAVVPVQLWVRRVPSLPADQYALPVPTVDVMALDRRPHPRLNGTMLWFADATGGAFASISAASGQLHTLDNVTALLGASDPASCPLAPYAASHAAPAFRPTGPMLLSAWAPKGANESGHGVTMVLPGIFPAAVTVADADADADGVKGGVGAAPVPPFWLVGLRVDGTEVGTHPRVMWCTPTPGAAPGSAALQGQMVVVSPASVANTTSPANTTLVLAMPDGVYGLKEPPSSEY